MGYLDNSGLYTKIGPETAVPSTGGEYKTYAELREIELTLNFTAAAFPFGTSVIVNDNIFFPKGVRVQEVETYVETAGVAGTSFDLGLMATDRTTVLAQTGFLAAFPLASFTPAGAKVIATIPGTAFGGTLLGTTTSQVGYLIVRANTSNFTAGTIKIRIRYLRD